MRPGLLVLAVLVVATAVFVAWPQDVRFAPLAPTLTSPQPRAIPTAGPPPAPHGALVLRRTQLRTSPGGRVVRALGERTRWGSRNVLGVVERRGGWIGVVSHHLRNSQVGWVPANAVRLVHEPYTMHIDVSDRVLVVRHAGRVARRVTIAVGRPGSTTPRGRFAITDLLRFRTRGVYGCCALALTARQPNVPQGWSGGDRIALHGTPNEAAVGSAATAGCMRATEADMQWLMRHIRLGAPVRVTA